LAASQEGLSSMSDILYKQRPEPVDVRLHADLGQAVTVLHLSPPKEAAPLAHNTTFRKNSFFLKNIK
jgi:hypothetical protein